MKKSSQGFTLLEILLVLAVVALLASSGLAGYQQRVTNFKVEQTALQMQAILEAAQAYHVNKPQGAVHDWPTCDGSGLGCDSTPVNDFQYFMQGAPLHNSPWYASTTQSYTATAPAGTQNYYTLAITIPAAQANAAHIAQMIAARLPSAVVNDRTVTASAIPITVPPSPGTGGIAVMSVQTFSNCTGGPNDPPHCTDQQPELFTPVSLTFVGQCAPHTFQKIYFSVTNILDYGQDMGIADQDQALRSLKVTDGQGNNPACFSTPVTSLIPKMEAIAPNVPTWTPKHMQFMATEVCSPNPCGTGDTNETNLITQTNNIHPKIQY